MAAPNFVAAEDGLEEDPKLVGLARLLKVPRGMAVYFVLRLRRLILRSGNHLVGSLPSKFGRDDIAGFLEFDGNPHRLIAAMKQQGYLSFKKGRGFLYPAWKDTTTGYWAHRREDDRIRHEVARRERRLTVQSRPDDVGGPSADASPDDARTSKEDQTRRKQPSTTGSPPDPPPAGGALVADERWSWIEKHVQRLQNRKLCKRLLAEMPPEDWKAVQRGYLLRTDPGASIPRKDRRVLEWSVDQFLVKQAYLRFREIERPARKAPKPRRSDPTPVVDIEQRQQEGDAFLMELLRDSEVSEAKKIKAQQRWLSDPQHAGRVPPWEATGSGEPSTKPSTEPRRKAS